MVRLAGRLARRQLVGFGLIGILALAGAIVLAVTGRYPKEIFDFVLGLSLGAKVSEKLRERAERLAAVTLILLGAVLLAEQLAR